MIPAQTLTAICDRHAPRPRTPPKLSAPQLISALVFHQLQEAGPLGAHTGQLHGIDLSESAHSQRRQLLPLALFDEVMRAALRPLATAATHPEAFYAGLRLVGIDGTEWSVTNTPQLAGKVRKAATRRLRAAFAKLRLVTVTELKLHNPLAAVTGLIERGEQTLAAQLWSQLPDASLLIADRLFGSPRTLQQAQQAWGDRGIHFLVRVKANIKARVVERLADGSALVDVPVCDDRKRSLGTLRVREIRAEVTSTAGVRIRVRLWTSLLDPVAHPAPTLAAHYIERWEHELYYRQVKLDLCGSGVLASHTLETALQELAALVLASAVVARVRVAAADHLALPPARVSFRKVLLCTQQLWQTLVLCAGLLTAAQRAQLAANTLEAIRRTALLPARRARSCPRVLRQTTSAWPRKIDQPSYSGRATLKILKMP